MALTGLSLSADVRTDRLGALLTRIDAKTNAGKILFYSLPLPVSTGATISSQTLLATCVLSKPSGTIANQRLTLDIISDELATPNDGVIAFGRIVDGEGVFIGDGLAGLANSSAVFKFNSLDVIRGGMVRILSGAINEGNA